MKRDLIKYILITENEKDVYIQGWVRTKRDSKGFAFLEVNDGSSLKNIQAIVEEGVKGFDLLKNISTGASVAITGSLVPSPGKGQKWEIKAKEINMYGEAPADYPLQKKGHTLEFMREIAHLRPRSNLFGAIFRVRSRLAYAVHKFFQERDFVYVHTPIVTASDCEGAGDLFRVTTIPHEVIKDGKVDYARDFFGKSTYLTVSGQLEGELFATALSNAYTFGPTFRAENSNTARHAAEFWMIEPEMAFADLDLNMQTAEDFVKFLLKDVMENCKSDLEFFSSFVDKKLMERLSGVLEKPFVRCTYTDAVDLIKKSGKKFEFNVEWGIDLQTEHERYLTEEHFKSPVIIYNYPKQIKPFYMRKNDDGKTVAAMDVLVPGIGELIGGSQREERLDILQANMEEHGLNQKDYYWYLDTRKYGTVPHSGFGLGFERMIMFATGVSNIRDVIPFPRTPKNAEF
ncbi:MAG: asparagine--tRNA ligase [Bdellovibrionales bacterium]|nr:asparagine--tRNA ligase [Bdellovibrionales bacterium]